MTGVTFLQANSTAFRYAYASAIAGLLTVPVSSVVISGFKGENSEPVYKDGTTKKAIVILKAYEKIIDGRTEEFWDVLLGDIGVEQTKTI